MRSPSGLSLALIAVIAALGCAAPVAAQAPAAPPAGDPSDPCTPVAPGPPRESAANYPGGLSSVAYGLTPATAPGATTVTPLEAACLFNRSHGSLVTLDVTQNGQGIPGAWSALFAASDRGLTGEVQNDFENRLKQATGGDLNRPLLVYCDHYQCFLAYNAALRAVKAGYTHVYWMREGIQVWADMGLPIAPLRYFAGMEPPPPPPEVIAARAAAADRVRKDAKETCDQSSRYETAAAYGSRLVSYKSLADADAAVERDMAEQVKYEQICFENRRRDALALGDAALAAEMDADKAGSVARLRAAHQRGRAAFEQNPLAFMRDQDGRAPATVRKILQSAAQPITLYEVCGRFDPSIPPLTKSAVDAFHVRWETYRVCLNRWSADWETQAKLSEDVITLEGYTKMLQGLKPYRCSVWPRPNCIPDARWNALDAVATPQALATVEAAHARSGNRNVAANKEAQVLEQTMQALQRAVEAYNNSQR